MRRLLCEAAIAAFAAFLLGFACTLPPAAAAAPDVPNIAAASDLQFALTDIAAAFTAQTGRDVRLSFGSSGNFRRQIADGAPFDVFLSADAAYADALVAERRTDGVAVAYAIGRLALFVPDGSPIEPDAELRGVAAALRAGRLGKFAIANPAHAPYGRAAREVLMHRGLWPAIESHLVLGENVSQAAQFAVSGGAQAGIVAASLLRAPGMAGRGRAVILPASDYDPLVQKMVLLARAGGTARAFFAFVQSASARAILERYGFAPPPTPPPVQRERPRDRAVTRTSLRLPLVGAAGAMALR
jgi:molybdate transport system substrate-binding protein